MRETWSKPDYLLVFTTVLTLLSLHISFWFRIMHCCWSKVKEIIVLIKARSFLDELNLEHLTS